MGALLDLDSGRDAWTELNEAATETDPSQTVSWLSQQERHYGRKVRLALVRREGELIGGQAVTTRRLPGGLRAHEAMGGPLVVAEKHRSDVMAAILELHARDLAGGAYHAIRPSAGHPYHDQLVGADLSPSALPTFIVDLSPSVDELWMSISKKARQPIRKNQERLVVEATDDWRVWREFAALHADHARRMGIGAMTEDELRDFHEHLLPAGAGRLIIATVGGELAAGMLYAVSRTSMRYLINCSRPDMLEYSPNDPIMWAAMQWGHAQGISTLDLYDTDPRPDSPLHGIHRFKRKWGGELIDRPYYIRGRLYHRLRERKRETAGRGLEFRLLSRLGMSQ